MGVFSRSTQPETSKLQEVVAELPAKVADWTPDQRAQFATQSDRAAFEQVSGTAKKKG
ncbi:hypothetical protein [Streptomyces sp. NPDC055109]